MWDNDGMDACVMTTNNRLIKEKNTLLTATNSVKAIGSWAPLYAMRAAGFCWGNWTTGAFLPNRPHGQSFGINISRKMSLDVI